MIGILGGVDAIKGSCRQDVGDLDCHKVSDPSLGCCHLSPAMHSQGESHPCWEERLCRSWALSD